jgi:hypothetical protein
MALTEQEMLEVKEQLRQQVNHLPTDKKQQALDQIENLSEEAIESLLAQQKTPKSSKNIFRAIVSGEIPSKILAENKEAIAVLDIKPITNGHVVIIPKTIAKDAKNIPKGAFSLGKMMAKKISEKLKPSSTKIITEYKFGETVVNILPIYDSDVDLLSHRSSLSEEELSKLDDLLRVRKKKKIEKIKIKKASSGDDSKIIRLNRRIP